MNQSDIEQITKRGVKEIISEREFIAMLTSGKKLRLKMGFDPSRPDIHLGHVVGLRKLRQLQDLGHQVILIVGDWTAQIGDPSGQSATRPMLTHDQVVENAESYMRQFFQIVDKDKTQVEWQSEWFGNFTLADILTLTSKFTVAQFLERDDFAKRFKEHKPIAITELLYPLLQAYDSVAIESDVEFGGTDQMFNLLVGRELQGIMGLKPQQCFLMPILVGTDGIQKMSKSLGNYIALEETPSEMYGKVMSLPDELIVPYFEYLTDVDDDTLNQITQDMLSPSVNPMSFKKQLAWDITAGFHGAELANESQSNFESVIQGGHVPDDIPVFDLSNILDSDDKSTIRLLVSSGLASSVSEAKRLVNQGAVELIRNFSGQTLNNNENVTWTDGDIIKVGKRRFIKLISQD
ncbi:MAG: tyrosine--tRNA ligase [Chloroflexota bacterium]|nr:tyrosine--tRNA ligase [Chloroflexota bacterium]